MAAGVVVVALVLTLLGVFVYVSMRQALETNIDEVLADRVELARTVADDRTGADLVDGLSEVGIPAVLELRDGEVLRSAPAPRFAPGPPPHDGTGDGDSAAQAVVLDDGSRLTVFVSREGVTDTLQRLLYLEVLGTVFGMLLAALLLIRASTVALQPLDAIVAATRRIAGGEHGVRLHPEHADTEVGRIATGVDDMIGALEHAVDDARSTEAFIEAFLADAAHQLRTPITAIRAAVDVLLMDLDEPSRARALELLASQSERAGQLLNALLRIARIDQGEVPAWQAGDLEQLCREEAARTQKLAPGLHVDVVAGLGSAEPIDFDPASMREALANLLDNARRFAVERIELRTTLLEALIEVRIIDDGPGMDPVQAERAFDRFVSNAPGGGSGLGLPIARGIIEAHGGTLTYDAGAFLIRLRRERRRTPREQAGRGPSLETTVR